MASSVSKPPDLGREGNGRDETTRRDETRRGKRDVWLSLSFVSVEEMDSGRDQMSQRSLPLPIRRGERRVCSLPGPAFFPHC